MGAMDTAFKHAVAHQVEGNFDKYLFEIQAVCAWTREDILPLVYLPNNVAYYLAHVLTVQPFQVHNFKLNLAEACAVEWQSGTNVYDWQMIGRGVTAYNR